MKSLLLLLPIILTLAACSSQKDEATSPMSEMEREMLNETIRTQGLDRPLL
ncbi:MAG: hypothetical protein ACSHYB_15340 [Roseibacillus sp.]